MAILWQQLKSEIIAELDRRDLADPRIRKNALERIEEYLHTGTLSKYFNNPILILDVDKKEFKGMLERRKGKILNGAESSVVNQIYDTLPVLRYKG